MLPIEALGIVEAFMTENNVTDIATAVANIIRAHQQNIEKPPSQGNSPSPKQTRLNRGVSSVGNKNKNTVVITDQVEIHINEVHIHIKNLEEHS